MLFGRNKERVFELKSKVEELEYKLSRLASHVTQKDSLYSIGDKVVDRSDLSYDEGVVLEIVFNRDIFMYQYTVNYTRRGLIIEYECNLKEV